MASFVEIDVSNIVIRGVALDDEDTQDESGNEVESVGAKYLSDGFGGTWKRTSYNTQGNIHRLDGIPFRKNFAGIGFTFDAARNAFIPPKPYDSWTINEDTCQWDAPTAYPDESKVYRWNEDTTSWDLISDGWEE